MYAIPTCPKCHHAIHGESTCKGCGEDLRFFGQFEQSSSSRVHFIFAWYDFWIGAFYDKDKRLLYLFPVPMFGVVIDCNRNSTIVPG